MTARAAVVALSVLASLAATVVPSVASEPKEAFRKGRLILSLEGGGGSQDNLDSLPSETGLDLLYFGARLGVVPFGPTGSGLLHGALEVGFEAIHQRYVDPVSAFWAGLAAVGRYHVLALGPFVPYLEIGGAIGGTDLEVSEIRSDFAFLAFGGVGGAVFLTANTALYAGYRLIHVSNGNVEDPNRGFEAHTGLAGVSFFFE